MHGFVANAVSAVKQIPLQQSSYISGDKSHINYTQVVAVPGTMSINLIGTLIAALHKIDSGKDY